MNSKSFLVFLLSVIAFNAFTQNYLYVPGSTTGIRSSGNSNFGIGISSPIYKFHVVAPANSWKARFSGTDGYIDIGPYNSSWAHIYTDRPMFLFNKPIYATGGVFSSGTNESMLLQTGGTTRVTLKNDGNIGFGCDPGVVNFKFYKAELPTFELASSMSRLQIGIATYGWAFANESQLGDVVFRPMGEINQRHGMIFFIPNSYNNGNSYIAFGDMANNLWVKILNNRTMRVDGTIYSKEIICQTNVWSDHVFYEDYNLMSLDELEKFIQVNNHLPDVPKESEIITNGINLGEMNAILLKKIEELTLHLIEQNKKITSLENIIELMK